MAERIALAYGLGTAVLGVLTLIAGRMGWLDPWFIRLAWPVAGLGLVRHRPGEDGENSVPTAGVGEPKTSAIPRLETGSPGSSALIAPFVAAHAARLDAAGDGLRRPGVSPPGPQGVFPGRPDRFLPHNVYTNMPFDVEMLHLLGMSVMGDWWWGALSGQLLVALFAPRRRGPDPRDRASRRSPRAGWIAALVYLSTPWVYRLGVIAYVEGPLCFYQAALVWAWLVAPRPGTASISPGNPGSSASWPAARWAASTRP